MAPNFYLVRPGGTAAEDKKCIKFRFGDLIPTGGNALTTAVDDGGAVSRLLYFQTTSTVCCQQGIGVRPCTLPPVARNGNYPLVGGG